MKQILRLAAVLLPCLWSAFAQQTSRIEGWVKDDHGTGMANIAVELKQGDTTAAKQYTDVHGHFAFDAVTPGRYNVSLRLADGTQYELVANAMPGATVALEQEIPANVGLIEKMTVFAASRETEGVLAAAAAITPVDPLNKTLYGAEGQVPSIMAGVPGAEVTQSGLFDFNFNVRGFNSLLNRRMAVQVDGRDPSVPFLGNQEWASLATMTDDIETLEVLRGPSAALYGKNSFNGVVNMTTLAPRDSIGGRLRFTFGQLKTAKLDGRWARGLGRGWYLKIGGGYLGSDDFSVSRNKTVEYPGLPMEVIPLPTRHVDLASGSVRADKYFSERTVLTIEGGVQSLAGPVFVSGIGRAQSDSIRTWTRSRFATPGWTLSFFSNTRNSPDQPALGSGVPIAIRDRNVQGEVQWDHKLAKGTTLMAGGNFAYETVDTRGKSGVQTLLSRPVAIHRGAVFGQVRQKAGERLTLSAALRMDASELHDTQFSPRASALYSLSTNQSLWASYSEAFQVANYAELFVQAPAGPPLDLSNVEAMLKPLLGNVSLGLNFVPVLALGNEHLKVEKIRSVQTGYTRLFRNRSLVTIDYYNNRMRDFITDVLPGVNPQYGPYHAPSALSPQVRSLVEGALNSAIPGFTNGPGGVPWIVLSLANVGRVSSQGVEIGATGWIGSSWQYNSSYSWFDYSLNDPASRSLVHSNSAKHRAAAGLGYRKQRFNVDARYRWTDAFFFASGIFHGPVPTYSVVDLGASYQISPKWEIGVNAGNLLNNEHYEIFGGDILKRHVLGFVAFAWK